jgi:hypothetical protein
VIAEGDAIASALAAPLGVPGSAVLPGSRTARVLQQGIPEAASHPPTLNLITRALTARSYEASSSLGVEVGTLRSLPANLGVLYYHGHAGLFSQAYSTKVDEFADFGIATDTIVTSGNEDAFADDVRLGRILYTTSVSDARDPNRTSGRGYYAVSGRFFEAYVKFAPGALVFLNACNGGHPLAAPFRAALFSKGVGAVVAWQGNITQDTYPAVAYFFDRALGANETEAPVPHGRPFTLDEVFAGMARKRHGTGADYLTEPHNGSKLGLYRNIPGTTLLAPNVKALRYLFNDFLGVVADLPAGTPTVLLDGQPLGTPVEQDGMLIVQLPQGSAGNVEVEVNGIRSNPRPIVSWRGDLTYVNHLAPPLAAPGSPRLTVTYHAHLRADPYGYRKEVDGPVEDDTPAAFYAAMDTTAEFAYSGTATATDGSGVTATWTGGGPLTYERLASPALSFEIVGSPHPSEGRLRIGPRFSPLPGKIVTSVGGEAEILVAPGPREFVDLPTPGVLNVFMGWYMPLEPDGSIAARTWTWTSPDVELYRLSWPRIQAHPVLSDEVAR